MGGYALCFMSQMLDPELSVVPVRSYFVRQRNALLVRGKFGPMYLDYYLHLMQHQLKNEEPGDTMLKEALAGITLHLCSRPQDESCAWTLNFHEPLMNLFVTGSTKPGRVTGRIFTEDVRDGGKNLFISQTTRPNQQPRQSMIEVSGRDALGAVEQFYTQSEQRLTRVFRLPDEEFVQISAEPDCDEAWLAALTLEQVVEMGQVEHLTLLETRGYVLECGCSPERLYPLISRLPQEDIDYVFSEGVAALQCPRCGARYRTDRTMFDDWLERSNVS
jgi:molecular chaperone Hsp33